MTRGWHCLAQENPPKNTACLPFMAAMRHALSMRFGKPSIAHNFVQAHRSSQEKPRRSGVAKWRTDA
jgi:hypothetical protein